VSLSGRRPGPRHLLGDICTTYNRPEGPGLDNSGNGQQTPFLISVVVHGGKNYTVSEDRKVGTAPPPASLIESSTRVNDALQCAEPSANRPGLKRHPQR